MPKDVPSMRQESDGVIEASCKGLPNTKLYCTPSPAPAAPAKGGVVLVDGPSVVPDLLFTENETNFEVRPSPRAMICRAENLGRGFTTGRTVRHT